MTKTLASAHTSQSTACQSSGPRQPHADLKQVKTPLFEPTPTSEGHRTVLSSSLKFWEEASSSCTYLLPSLSLENPTVRIPTFPAVFCVKPHLRWRIIGQARPRRQAPPMALPWEHAQCHRPLPDERCRLEV
jgi:hypothetical protein